MDATARAATVSRTPRHLEDTYIEPSDSDDVAEVFSPPRVVVFARALQLNASLSVDLLTGTDLRTLQGRVSLERALTARHPLVIVLSPPCTMYSALTWSLNRGRTPDDKWDQKMHEANIMLNLAMEVAARQVVQGRYFVFEHPATARSWSTQAVRDVMAMRGVRLAAFDQCRYGLKSPSGRPIRKRAWFLTNCSFVFEEFDGKLCNCTQRHQHVIGSDLGEKLSAWAAHYPPALCRALSLCVRRRRFQRQAAALRGQ